MIYRHKLQATHRTEPPSWTGRSFTPRGGRWFRVWVCPDHLEGEPGSESSAGDEVEEAGQ
jgi:hypothetical protein